MASYLTSTTLIESVKRRQSIPTSQYTFEDADFLAFANEEVMLGILPTVMQYHEEYFVYTQNIPLEANKASYPIPARAIGSKVRLVRFMDNGGTIKEVARINPEDALFYQSTTNSINSVTKYFYIQNNMLKLVPNVGANPTGELVVDYFMRPNQLVVEDRCAVITAINTNTGVISIDALPSGMSTSTRIDFIETSGGHRTKSLDILPTATSPTSITVATTDIPADLVVGDYVNFAGETFIPQIPDDLHPMLAQRVAARCVEALGDVGNLQAANQKLAEMEIKTANLVDNRTEGNPQKVVNIRGPLSRRNRWWW
jgi:hypothetical protein